MVALLSLLAAGNRGFHLEAHFKGIALYSSRLGIAVVLILIMVVGGRTIPSFTRNWLMRREPGRMPAPFGRFDVACITLSTAALALWVVMPEEAPTDVGLLAAAALNFIRLCRWAGYRSFSDRLVLLATPSLPWAPCSPGCPPSASRRQVPASMPGRPAPSAS